MTRVLVIHQNLPGQLRRPMRYLRTRPGCDAVAIGAGCGPAWPKMRARLVMCRPFRWAASRLDVGFDAASPVRVDDRPCTRIENAVSLLSLLSLRSLLGPQAERVDAYAGGA